jgi:hypothetical protein
VGQVAFLLLADLAEGAGGLGVTFAQEIRLIAEVSVDGMLHRFGADQNRLAADEAGAAAEHAPPSP